MNKKDTARIMKMLKAAYPDFDKNGNAEDIMNLWAWRFKDTPVEVVFKAVGDYIDGNCNFKTEYPPKVGQIKAIIRSGGPKMSAAAGWHAIEMALKDSLANAVKEFEQLPDPVKHYVGSPETLRQLAGSDLNGSYYQDYQERFFRNFSASQDSNVSLYEELNALDDYTKEIKQIAN